jgi:hypothetical protein
VKPEEERLLREVVMRHRPDLENLLDTLGKIPLGDDDRESLREAVHDEYLSTGLKNEDYEPNERGLWLEELIDRLGHL